MTLTGAVMTHPRRIAAAGEVAAKDPKSRIQVVTDPDPTGPPTALRTANPSWNCVGSTATHHIVLQDDVLLADDFFSHVEAVAAAVPDEAVAFYEGWEGRNSGVVRLGALTGAQWGYAIDEHVPSLALMLPAEAARGYAKFAAQHGDGWPYDVVMQRYLKALGMRVRIAVPSTVDHDDVPSLAGNSKHGWRRATYFAEKADAVTSQACADFDVVPFYQYGESKCAVRYGARWDYLDTDRYLGRIGLAERCDSGFAGLSNPVGEGLPATVRRQAWLTAFATGVVVAGLTQQDPNPDTARAVMESLGPGGLCEEYTDAELLPMIPRIRDLATKAFEAGRTARRAQDGAMPSLPADVVVTGGNPAFGEHLVRLLGDEGCRSVYAERLVSHQEVHTVVHLGDPQCSPHTVTSTLMAAEKLGVQRLLHISSAAVYRNQSTDVCRENTLSAPPTDAEARAWWDEEQEYLHWGKRTGVTVQIMRLAEQVGPHAPLNGVLATWMLKAWTRRPMALLDGRRHQLVDHRDVAGALAAVLALPAQSPVYNVASAQFDEMELAELAAQTARLTPWEQAADAPPPASTMSTTLITDETGWVASADIRSGARAQAQWLACDTHDDLAGLGLRRSR
ncbi:NAD-dependent epimerase/dehydratase family protein [Streptomyces sp. AM 2-1-1]|uniref:NAD-dependent epimerase/dehydratase family protein n=1 Tax=Streptomyces sp. AM 2-1-1 TaxID=3028709 RepID=UPI0023B9DF24|nr:NAD-dependent epimerase/dehydratase family protein [Streptomyces sp. AM 2-1-1]WEH43923.1 NAD-dependent epimerase/dehydratase family protein [Streptomyces sp. AM 2-1-1]